MESLIVHEIFSVKVLRHLENLVRGCSRSLKLAPFDRSYTTFCWSAIVNIALSCTVFEFSLLLFHAGQAAIKLPSAEASKRAQCTSLGQYAPYIKGIMKTP